MSGRNIKSRRVNGRLNPVLPRPASLLFSFLIWLCVEVRLVIDMFGSLIPFVVASMLSRWELYSNNNHDHTYNDSDSNKTCDSVSRATVCRSSE